MPLPIERNDMESETDLDKMSSKGLHEASLCEHNHLPSRAVLNAVDAASDSAHARVKHVPRRLYTLIPDTD